MIKKIEEETIYKRQEDVLTLKINGKQIKVNKYFISSDWENDSDFEVVEGKELLTEEEQDELWDFING